MCYLFYRINKIYRKVIIGGALKYTLCTPVRSDIITQFSKLTLAEFTKSFAYKKVCITELKKMCHAQ